MKKRCFALILAGIICLTGCGNKEQDQAVESYQNMGMTKDEAQEVAAAVYGDDTNTKAGTTEESGSAENSAEEYKVYDAVPEWDGINPGASYVQIDDVLYPMHFSSTEEFFKLLESSEVVYGGYDSYNSSRMMAHMDKEDITITRDGVPWIEVKVRNKGSELVTMANAEASIDVKDAAIPYCRFIDGTSYDEFCKMTYDDLKAYGNGLIEKNPTCTFATNDLTSTGDILPMEFIIGFVSLGEPDSNGYREVDYGYRHYVFDINKDTGMAQGIKNGVSLTGTYSTHNAEEDKDYVFLLKDLLPEEKEQVMNIIEENVHSVTEFETIALTEQYFCVDDYMGSPAPGMGAIVELTKADGSNSYVVLNWGPWNRAHISDSYQFYQMQEVSSLEEAHGLINTREGERIPYELIAE